ncbi:MAG: response regulator transcription factor [Candidatus Hermodarchaeia archaeon]|jgi:FixJ family two-component response regulator
MTNINKQHVFFVDDEPKVRKIVGRTLEQTGLKVSYFARATECLKQLHSQKCDLLITDKVKRIIPSLPVLVITGYGDIKMAVKALKAGASDFIEKPLDRQSFLSAVESVLNQNTQTHPLVGKVLTKTELRVLRLMLDGKSNKEIASLLHRSTRTIEDHRSHIMRKLGAYDLMHLVRLVAVVRMPDLA